MKTNFIILLILLLTVSVGNAQSVDSENVAVKTSEIVSVEDNAKQDAVNTVEEDNTLIDTVEFEAILARTTSDIRSYLNRERNISNIGLLFPTIEKRVKA
ncbi:hypothetical protein JCM19274_4474 [Algibacter lectus]|uniref:TonB-dependent receptor n=1 Tax=Algibacter lectus TaxID=221126 RepID=A0A090WLR0_9FLAO|nr:hypothetical protein [Algibacter lectus]GAL77975.1 hypothetical protein JCM19274_4474 [Algibacter lectus]